jgi:hypothetical protein
MTRRQTTPASDLRVYSWIFKTNWCFGHSTDILTNSLFFQTSPGLPLFWHTISVCKKVSHARPKCRDKWGTLWPDTYLWKPIKITQSFNWDLQALCKCFGGGGGGGPCRGEGGGHWSTNPRPPNSSLRPMLSSCPQLLGLQTLISVP